MLNEEIKERLLWVSESRKNKEVFVSTSSYISKAFENEELDVDEVVNTISSIHDKYLATVHRMFEGTDKKKMEVIMPLASIGLMVIARQMLDNEKFKESLGE